MGCGSAAARRPRLARLTVTRAYRNSESAHGRPGSDEEGEAEASFKAYIRPVRAAASPP
jgi:hypothetical protein